MIFLKGLFLIVLLGGLSSCASTSAKSVLDSEEAKAMMPRRETRP